VQDLEVAIIQDALDWHDPAANRRRFDEHLRHLPPADVIVLPEMFTTGFTMAAAEYAEPMDGLTVAWMQEHARSLDAVVCGSLIVRETRFGEERYFNRLVWATPDGTLTHYDKRHLFRHAGETEHYTAGAERVVVEHRGWRIAPMVCYDLRFPVWSRHSHDCDALVYVANWPAPRHGAWEALLRARAIENQCYVIGVNRSGPDGNGLDYRGGSAVVDFLGATLRDCGREPCATTCVLSRDGLRTFRRDYPFHLDADTFRLSD
jgi:predicted amidohydrolase